MLFQCRDVLELKVLELCPELTLLGETTEEASSLQAEHQRVLEKIQVWIVLHKYLPDCLYRDLYSFRVHCNGRCVRLEPFVGMNYEFIADVSHVYTTAYNICTWKNALFFTHLHFFRRILYLNLCQ